MGESKTKIFLHTCCAVCGRLFAEFLAEGYEPVIYYDNPNVFPKEEYVKRKDEAETLARKFGLRFIEGDYDHTEWLSLVKKFASEPEGGKRCDLCFRIRLDRAARKAEDEGIDLFTTTLALSPYKNAASVKEAGEAAAELIKFLTPWEDFDKRDFWRRNMEIVRKEEIYRQSYCGCEYSILSRREKRDRAKASES